MQYAPDSRGELLFWLPFVGDHQEVSPLASIERIQGKNGVSYKVRYRLPPGEDGNRKWETKTFRRKKDAALFRAEIDRSIYRGDFAGESRITVRELCDRVMRDHVEVRLAENTVRSYRSTFSNRILPAFGDLRITEVRRQDAQRFYRDLVDGGVGVPSAKKAVLRLSTVLNLAVEWELLTRNPVRGVKLPKETRRELTVLDAAGARLLLETAEGNDYHIPVLLALSAGLRLGEVLGLQWDCVDFETNSIHVTRSMVYSGGKGHRYAEPKTPSSVRAIAVHSDVMDVLRARQAFLNEEFSKRGVVESQPQVCAFPDGRLMKRSALHRGFKRLLKKAGLPDMRFHDLRHTHATLLLQRGHPVHHVQRRMGHATIVTTLNTYAHIFPGDDKTLGDAIWNILG